MSIGNPFVDKGTPLALGPLLKHLVLLESRDIPHRRAVSLSKQEVRDDIFGEGCSRALSCELPSPTLAVNTFLEIFHVDLFLHGILEDFEESLLHLLKLLGFHASQGETDLDSGMVLRRIVDCASDLFLFDDDILQKRCG